MKKSYIIRVEFHWYDTDSWIIDKDCKHTSDNVTEAWIFSDGGEAFEYVCANYDKCDLHLIEVNPIENIVNELMDL